MAHSMEAAQAMARDFADVLASMTQWKPAPRPSSQRMSRKGWFRTVAARPPSESPTGPRNG
eukprot:6450803-Pyramimonas_sp.AAC.1